MTSVMGAKLLQGRKLPHECLVGLRIQAFLITLHHGDQVPLHLGDFSIVSDSLFLLFSDGLLEVEMLGGQLG